MSLPNTYLVRLNALKKATKGGWSALSRIAKERGFIISHQNLGKWGKGESLESTSISLLLDAFPELNSNDLSVKPNRGAMMIEAKSVTGPDSSPCFSMSLSEEEMLFLKKFRTMDSDGQDEAIALFMSWMKLPKEKQKEMVDCARAGKTCFDVVNGVGEARRGIAPLPSSASTVKTPQH